MVTVASQGVLQHSRTFLITIMFALICCCPLRAQQQQNLDSAATIHERIDEVEHLIQTAPDQHLSDNSLGYLWAVLASDYRKTGDFSASERAYFKALDLLRRTPSSARNYATTLDNLAMLYLTYGRLDEAERYNKQASKIRSHLGIPLDEARGEENRSEIDLAKHRFKAAENEADRALQILEAQRDPNQLDIIAALNVLGFSHCLRRSCEQGMSDALRSFDIARSHYGSDSMPAAHALLAVGFARWKMGQLEEADSTMRSAIEMMRGQPDSERALLFALGEYRDYLVAVHRDVDAKWAAKLMVETQSHESYCPTCINVHALSNSMR